MREKIQMLLKELNDDRIHRRQEFVSFSEKEKAIVMEAEKRTGLPKQTAIAIACQFLIQNLNEAEGKEKDGK